MGQVWAQDRLPAQREFVADRLFVKPRADLDAGVLKTLHDQLGTRVLHVFENIGGIQVVSVPKGLGVRETVRLYAESGLVAYAEPVPVYTTQQPDDPLYTDGTLWGLHNEGQAGLADAGCSARDPDFGTPDADIDAPEGWGVRSEAPDVIVAIVDTGIRVSHEDLVENLWVNPDEIAGTVNDDDGNGYVDDVNGINALVVVGSPNADPAYTEGDPSDDHGHGTHVAGTIGAEGDNALGVTGVARRVKLMGLKAGYLCETSDGTETGCLDGDAVIAAYEYAAAHGAKFINASFGGVLPSQAHYDAIVQLRDDGIVLVAAAGNGIFGLGFDTDLLDHYPSGYPLDNIVSVAATDRNDHLAEFSNYGIETVDLAAPGVAIFSTAFSGDSDYECFDGTSMATPHVAGALAVIHAQFPDLAHGELIHRLLASTDRPPALAGRVGSEGRLNLHRALSAELLADFERTPLFGYAPLEVTFEDASIGEVSSYSWEFGDGASDTGASATHTYTQPGAYTATLQVSGPAGSASRERTVFVLQPPVPPDLVPVGDAANAADDSGLGAVGSSYQIGRHEITNTEYAGFLNVVADLDDPNGLYSFFMGSNAAGGIERRFIAGRRFYFTKPNMAGKPVNFVSYYDVLRYANWVHNGQPWGPADADTTEDGAYTFDDVASVGLRNPYANVFLPSEDEWYKAAYYKGGGPDAGYWSYPTQSDDAPECAQAFDVGSATPGDTSNPDNDPAPPDGVANFGVCAPWNDVPRNVTTVASAGSDSIGPYETYDQGGNVHEWVEQQTSDGGTNGMLRGGGIENSGTDASGLAFSSRVFRDPVSHQFNAGFRLAARALAAPQIVEDPQSVSAPELSTVRFSVEVRGYPVEFRWQHRPEGGNWQDVVEVPGRVRGVNARILVFDQARKEEAGSYRVVVSNAFGEQFSQPATLNLTPFMEFVTVGAPDNPHNVVGVAPTCRRFGGVDYTFEIGKFEITNWQYAIFLNAVAKELDAHQLYDPDMEDSPRGGIERTGGLVRTQYVVKPFMADKPVNFVSLNDAMRFSNWLHNGAPTGMQSQDTTEDGAYSLGNVTLPGVFSIVSAPRNAGALYFVPSLNEWYKAAYFKPDEGYFSFATGSNDPPACATALDLDTGAAGDVANPDATPGPVNFMGCADWNGVNGNVTTVGSAGAPGPFGTFDQNGNVSERTENEDLVFGGSYESSLPGLDSSIPLGGLDIVVAGWQVSRTGWRAGRIESGYEPPTEVAAIDGSCADVGQHTSLVYDTSGRAHVSYYDVTNADLKYAVRVPGNGWTIQTVDNDGDVGRYNDIALDSQGRPHISYHDFDRGILKHARLDSTGWVIETPDPSAGLRTGLYTSIGLDADDQPHISYIAVPPLGRPSLAGREFDINVLWPLEYGILPPRGAGDAPVSLPRADGREDGIEEFRPGVFFGVPEPRPGIGLVADGGHVRYVMRTQDGWTTPDVVDDGSALLQDPQARFVFTSIAVTPQGTPHIAYHDGLERSLRYARWACRFAGFFCSWSRQTVDSDGLVGRFPSIALSPTERFFVGEGFDVHISYYDHELGRLKHAGPNYDRFLFFGSSWHIELVDNAGDVGRFSSLAVDDGRAPHVAYYDADNTDLKSATRSNGQWNTSVVHGTGRDVGMWAAIALDPAQRPGIVYYDATYGELLYSGP